MLNLSLLYVVIVLVDYCFKLSILFTLCIFIFNNIHFVLHAILLCDQGLFPSFLLVASALSNE